MNSQSRFLAFHSGDNCRYPLASKCLRYLQRRGYRKCCRKFPLCVASRKKCVMHLGRRR